MTDVTFYDCGTVVTVRLHTPEARAWVAENVAAESYQWTGDRLVIEHRYAEDILRGMVWVGLNVKRG